MRFGVRFSARWSPERSAIASDGVHACVRWVYCIWHLRWDAPWPGTGPRFFFFRVVGGLAIGISSVTGPTYIAEISPAAKRGRLVGMFQTNIVLGILLAYLSNSLIASARFGEAEWRWKFGMGAIPSAVFLVALLGIPESPRWLVAAGRREDAREVLHKIGERNPEQDLQTIGDTLKKQSGVHGERLFQSRYRKPIFLAISIGMFNQLSGINAILYYLNDIFERAGFSKVSGDWQAVAIGFTNLVFTLIAMSMIDRLGRKKLLLAGAVGTAICLIGIAMIFATARRPELLLWLLIGFSSPLSHSHKGPSHLGLPQRSVPESGSRQGPEPRELHPLVHECADFGDVSRFLAARSGAVPFAVFAAMMLVQFLVVLTLYPETKELDLERMGHHMTAIMKNQVQLIGRGSLLGRRISRTSGAAGWALRRMFRSFACCLSSGL